MTRSQARLQHIAARHRESRTLHERGMPEVGMIDVINDQLEILGDVDTQAPESQGYKVLGTTHETWWRSLQRHRPDLHAYDGDDDPRGRARDHLSTQPCEMVVDRHIAQNRAHVAALVQGTQRRSGTCRIDDHRPHDRCHHGRLAIVDDQEQQGDVSNHAGDDCLPHQASRRPMHRSDDIFTQLEAVRDHECPRFQLQRRLLSIGGIFAEGCEATTTIRGIRFRFTAILCDEGTTYALCWDTTGGWPLDRLETPDRSIVTKLFRHFIGFASSIIEAEPAIRDFGFQADPGDPFRVRFYTKATEVIARRWHATSVIRPFTYVTEFRITLPENT
jgi:hypothetical protein